MGRRAEYIEGQDGALDSEGWYGATGYLFPGFHYGTLAFDMELVARFESYDPDVDLGGLDVSGPTVGVNMLFDDYNSKLQLSYTRFEAPIIDDEVLILAVQIAF